jgi:hypothetical protein
MVINGINGYMYYYNNIRMVTIMGTMKYVLLLYISTTFFGD